MTCFLNLINLPPRCPQKSTGPLLSITQVLLIWYAVCGVKGFFFFPVHTTTNNIKN